MKLSDTTAHIANVPAFETLCACTFSMTELLTAYNELTGKATSKFASRQKGEQQVWKAVQEFRAANPAVETTETETDGVYGYGDHGLTECPHCGVHLSNGVGVHGQEVNGKVIKHTEFQFACLVCGGEFGAPIRKVAKSAKRSEGIAASWADPDVAERRATRHAVKVDGESVYGSFRKAFVALGLPLNKHITLRGTLKAEGVLVAFDHTFTLVADDE